MKFSIMKITSLAGLLAVFAFSVQAQWTLIDNFEGYADGVYTADAENLVYPAASNGGMGEMDIISGIPGTGDEKAAWFWFGVQEANAGDVWHQIPLVNEIGVNEKVTVSFRAWQQAYDINWHWMLSKVAAGDEPDGTALWGNQSAILRVNNSEPLMMDIRNGGSYTPSNPIHLQDLSEWYQYWVVVDNSFAADETQAGIGGYEVYVQGPADSAPRLLSWGGETTVTKVDFRNQAFTSIKAIVLIQNANTAPNIWLIDDIYQAPGENLTDPTEPVDDTQWCEMAKTGADVDTGDFMGWIYVGDLTGAGWVYSYSLGGFVYVSACPGESGAWVYVLN